MPKLIDLRARETVDLHAPWWSEAKDEATGRYLERVVVYAVMTEKDEQYIALQVQPKVTPGQGRQQTSISMAETAYSRRHLLLRMITEITDEEGQAIVPLTADVVDRLPKRDSAWIADEIAELNKPLVVPTEEDVKTAEIAAEKYTAEGKDIPYEETAMGIAEARFRKSGQGAVQGRAARRARAG